MTPSQLLYVLREEIDGNYFSDDEEGKGYEETTTNPEEDGPKPTTDKVAKEMPNRNVFPFGRYGYGGGILPQTGGYLYEMNKNIKQNIHKVSNPLAQVIKANVQSVGKRTIGTKRAEKLLTGFTHNYASNLLSDIESGKISAEEYQLLGGDKLKHELQRLIKIDQNVDKGFKESASAAGLTNMYQKPGGVKNSFNGQAHTPKSQW